MNFTDETVMAYVDGELEPQARAALEAALATDADLARRVASCRALTVRLRGAYDPVMREPVPDALVAAARQAPSARATVTSIESAREARPPRAKRSWSWPAYGSLAASVAIGLIIGHFVPWARDPLAVEHNQIVARGELSEALANQLASDQPRTAPVRIGLSFRSKSGSYCRTFALQGDERLAGLACRAGGDWRVDVLARAAGTASGGVEQAGSEMPESVARAVDASIAGEAFDSAAEAAARQRQWRD
jgi:anti-sigma factor RsiW